MTVHNALTNDLFMDQVEQELAHLGFTSTEIRIYRAGLEFGPIGVQALVRHTRIKRPTVYHALSTLTAKGLVGRRGSGQQQLFVMAPPTALGRLVDDRLAELERQKTALAAVIPLFTVATVSSLQRVSSVQYEGIDGVKTVIETALYCKGRHWDIIAPPKNFFSEIDKSYAEYYLRTRRDRRIFSRSLWEAQPGRRVLTEQEIAERQPRYMPESMAGRFTSMIILFDDKVALIPPLTHESAILLSGKDVHDVFLAMFDALWESSKPYAM